MSDCKRILQVVSTMNRGGLESMLMSLYRNIDRKKIQFDFVVHTDEKGSFDDEILSLGGKIYHAPRYTVLNGFQYKNWWKSFFLSHKEYQIIHSHTYSIASIQLPIAKRNGLTTIVHCHSSSTGTGIKGKIKTVLQRDVGAAADYLFSCSQKAGEWLFGKDCREKENYFLLKNAVKTDMFVFDENIRTEIREELQISDKFVIGNVGRIDALKNHSYLLEVFKAILEKKENAKLLLVGDGILREQIEKKAEELNIRDKVIMTGVRTDVNKLLQAMDCFVFPSLREGLPVTVVEAQAAGLPCFISDRVTDEVCVTDLVEMLSIDEEPTVWSEKILAKASGFVRENMKEQIAKSGYDIESTAKWLTEFYINCEGE